jgi:hypothetical protein
VTTRSLAAEDAERAESTLGVFGVFGGSLTS